MGMKPTVPDDGSIQHQIGTAYGTVKSVADNLEDLLELKNQFDVFGSTYVPNTRTINGKPLSADINLNAGDVGARVSSWVPAWLDITSKPTTLAGYGITDAQKLDATLTALSNTVTAANKLIYFTAEDTTATTDISSFGRTLIDDADASAARTTLGLGSAATFASTAFQAASATLSTFNTNIASVNVGVFKKTAANVWDFVALTDADIPNLNVSKLTAGTLPVVRGGTGRSDNKSAALITPVTITIGSTGKSFDGSASVVWTLAELGAQAVNANLTSFSALSGVADRVPYFTGPNTVALTNYTAFARSMNAAVDAAAVNTLLGVRTKAELDTIADFFTRATLDYDFANAVYKEYKNKYITELPLLDAVTCARNSTATAEHPFGVVTYEINEPRVQYNPLTGARLGLLGEETRTNLLKHSQYTGASGNTPPTNWVFAQSTAVTTTGPSPRFFGATRITHTGTNQRAMLEQVVTLAANTTYTFSAYFAAGTVATGRVMRVEPPAGDTPSGVRLLEASVITAPGVYSLTFTTGTVGGNYQFLIGLGGTGDNTGTVIHETPQLEVGSTFSSYIPTTSIALARLGALQTVPSLPAMAAACPEYTIYLQFTATDDRCLFGIASAITGFNNTVYFAEKTAYIRTNNVLITSMTFNYTYGTKVKVAIRIKAGDYALAGNGLITGASSAAGAPPTDLGRATVFNGPWESTPSLIDSAIGIMERIVFIPKALTNAEMQLLTK